LKTIYASVDLPILTTHQILGVMNVMRITLLN